MDGPELCLQYHRQYMVFHKKENTLRYREIKSKEDLIERFWSAWNETTQLEIEKLYASTPSRCKDFIFKKGHMSKF